MMSYSELQIEQYKSEWLLKREPIIKLADICAGSENHQWLAKRLRLCGNQHVGYEINGELKFYNVSHCRVRPCSECQSARRNLYNSKFKNWIGQFLQDRPELKFLYLSVGFKNVPFTEIVSFNDQLHDGIRRLFRKGNTKLVTDGWTTFFHFTISDKALIHFNTHSIIAVDPKYCDIDKYLESGFWSQLIRKRFKLRYSPEVDVQLIGLQAGNLEEELLKAYSYSAKEQDYILGPEISVENPEAVTLALIDGLASSRSIATGGAFRSFPKTAPKATCENRKPVWMLEVQEKEFVVSDLRKINVNQSSSKSRGI